METLTRAQVISKLNKLKAFIERDCGNETANAQRIADRLIKDYGICSSEFSYIHFSEKRKQDEIKAKAEKAYYEYKQKQKQEQEQAIMEFRVSYTSCMRDVVIVLIHKHFSIGNYKINGGKIFVYCTTYNYARFSAVLEMTKEKWSAAVKIINSAIINNL